MLMPSVGRKSNKKEQNDSENERGQATEHEKNNTHRTQHKHERISGNRFNHIGRCPKIGYSRVSVQKDTHRFHMIRFRLSFF